MIYLINEWRKEGREEVLKEIKLRKGGHVWMKMSKCLENKKMEVKENFDQKMEGLKDIEVRKDREKKVRHIGRRIKK